MGDDMETDTIIWHCIMSMYRQNVIMNRINKLQVTLKVKSWPRRESGPSASLIIMYVIGSSRRGLVLSLPVERKCWSVGRNGRPLHFHLAGSLTLCALFSYPSRTNALSECLDRDSVSNGNYSQLFFLKITYSNLFFYHNFFPFFHI